LKVLHTKRSVLQPVRAEHAAAMFALLSDARLYEFIPDTTPTSLAALTERFRQWESRRSPDGSQQWLNWIIQASEREACLGYVQATLYTPRTADFAFLLGSAHWGRGLAYDACAAALETLIKDHGLLSIFATADRRNIRSVSLLTRLGFSRVEPDTYPHGQVSPADHVFHLNHSA